MYEKIRFFRKFRKYFDLRLDLRIISILVKFSKNFDFWSNFRKKIRFWSKFSKIFKNVDFSKIFEKFRVWSNFRKISNLVNSKFSIFSKISKTFDKGQIFE